MTAFEFIICPRIPASFSKGHCIIDIHDGYISEMASYPSNILYLVEKVDTWGIEGLGEQQNIKDG